MALLMTRHVSMGCVTRIPHQSLQVLLCEYVSMQSVQIL